LSSCEFTMRFMISGSLDIYLSWQFWHVQRCDYDPSHRSPILNSRAERRLFCTSWFIYRWIKGVAWVSQIRTLDSMSNHWSSNQPRHYLSFGPRMWLIIFNGDFDIHHSQLVLREGWHIFSDAFTIYSQQMQVSLTRHPDWKLTVQYLVYVNCFLATCVSLRCYISHLILW